MSSSEHVNSKFFKENQKDTTRIRILTLRSDKFYGDFNGVLNRELKVSSQPRSVTFTSLTFPTSSSSKVSINRSISDSAPLNISWQTPHSMSDSSSRTYHEVSAYILPQFGHLIMETSRNVFSSIFKFTSQYPRN